MKKKVKTVCQIIRFRGKIEAFLVSIDLFDIPTKSTSQPQEGINQEFCILHIYIFSIYSYLCILQLLNTF